MDRYVLTPEHSAQLKPWADKWIANGPFCQWSDGSALYCINGVRRVLAEGEVTGHAHRADAGVLQETGDGSLVLDACDGATITHEEHGEIRVAPGKWDIVIVQEFDHAAESARNVAD